MRTTEKKKELANYIDQFDVVDILSKKTHYYKYQIKNVLDALEEMIYEHMKKATIEKPSECRLFFGFIIGAKRIPEYTKKMPHIDEPVLIPEHINPFVTIKETFRKKVNDSVVEEEEYVDEEAE